MEQMIEKQVGKIYDSFLNEVAAFPCTLRVNDKSASDH